MTSFVLLDSEGKLLIHPCDQFCAILKLQAKFCLYVLAQTNALHSYFELIFEVKKTVSVSIPPDFHHFWWTEVIHGKDERYETLSAGPSVSHAQTITTFALLHSRTWWTFPWQHLKTPFQRITLPVRELLSKPLQVWGRGRAHKPDEYLF